MTLEQKIDTILSYVKRIHKQQAMIAKPRWVNASWISRVTGWSGKELESARENNVVTYRVKLSKETANDRTKRVYEYDLNSIPEYLIKIPPPKKEGVSLKDK